MPRVVLGFLIGLIVGILLTIVFARTLPRKPQPTSVIVNERTSARQIRPLRTGFDSGTRYFKPRIEQH
jgi:hypothetical protein